MFRRPPADPLDTLIPSIARGDRAAFETVFRALHAPLCEVVTAYVRSDAVAQEIVQDLFLVLWVERERPSVRSSLRGYLFTAARNRAMHYLRHQSLVHRTAASRPDDVRDGAMARSSPLSDELLVRAEDRAALRAAIDALPERARLAVVLRWDYEMPNADVATALGISVKGVEKLLSVAMRKLRDHLGPAATMKPE